MNPFFGALVDAELAEYVHFKESISLDEALDLNEQLMARVENEWRSHDAAEKKAREKR